MQAEVVAHEWHTLRSQKVQEEAQRLEQEMDSLRTSFEHAQTALANNSNMVRTGWQQMIVLQQNIMQAQAHKQDTTQIGL